MEKFISQNIIKKLIIALSIVLGFMVVVFLCLKLLFSQSLIEKNFYNIVGLKLEITKPEIVLDTKFNVCIKANEINLFDKDKKAKFLYIKDLNTTFKPTSLIFNKIDIKNFKAKDLIITINKDEKGEIDILKEYQENGFLNKPLNKNFSIKRLNSDIENLKLSYIDNYKIKSQTNLSIQNSTVKLNKNKIIVNQKGKIETTLFNKKQIANIDIFIDSIYPIKNDENSMINVDIDNVNLHIFSHFFEKYISKDVSNIDGNLKIEILNKTFYINAKNLNLKFKDNKNLALYPEGITLKGIFDIDKNFFELSKVKLSSNSFDINLEGNVKNFNSNFKNTDFDFNIDILNTQIYNLVQFIPDDIMYYNPDGIKTLKKAGFVGILNGKLNVNSSLKPASIEGNIKASDVRLKDYKKPYRPNDVNLNFLKNQLRVYTRVYTTTNEYVTIDGVSNLDESLYGKYSVISTKNVDLEYAQTYLNPIHKIIGFNLGPVPIMEITGFGNIDIKTKGTLEDAQIFGEFEANNATATIKGLDAKLINGSAKLIFDDRNLIFKEIKGKLKGSDFLLTGFGDTKGNVDIDVDIKNIKALDGYNLLKTSIIAKPYENLLNKVAALSNNLDLKANLKGSNLLKEYDKDDFLAKLTPSGEINFKNNKVVFNNSMFVKNLLGKFSFGDNQQANLTFNIGNSNNSNFELGFNSKTSLDKIVKNQDIEFNSYIKTKRAEFNDVLDEVKNINEKFKNSLSKLNDINFLFKMDTKHQGKINLSNLNLNNVRSNGYIIGLNSSDFENIKFLSGIVKFEGDNLKLNSMNLKYRNLPVYFDANVRNMYSNNPFVETTFSALLDEKTADNIINPYLNYPIKIKGEIPLKGAYRGNLNSYDVNFNLALPVESDISFSGANLGDIDIKREIEGRFKVDKNKARIDNIRLIKYIQNQNNKINPLTTLKAYGEIIQNNNSISYNNFKVITTTPINVRMLNLIFKKSLLKKGTFECAVNLNGDALNPKVTGKFFLDDLDIPLYDTQINDIKVDISNNNIIGKIDAKNSDSDMVVDFNALNKLTPPYIVNDINIQSNKLNISQILNSLTPQTVKSDINKKQDFSIKPEDVMVKKGTFNFKDVSYEKISAKNLKGNFDYKDNIFNLKDIILDIAKGTIVAKGNYNIKNTKLNLDAIMEDCDSNILTKDFLKLPDQIFGKINGSINLEAKNLNTPNGIKTLHSEVNFAINDGKMPKLGSLEYLLQAGSLIKNGILGLSLNNIIQVLTPYKTGEFEKIIGTLSIKGGEVKKIEILSKGKNLSLYLEGSYSILENFADIDIYGRLSKNVSGAIDKVSNVSIKQFVNSFAVKKNKNQSLIEEKFNKIPALEDENNETSNKEGQTYFRAKVLGDINKDNYIKSFSFE